MKINLVPSPYSDQQIVAYLQAIKYFDNLTSIDAGSLVAQFDPSLENLNILVRRHLLTFPFENTILHYTPEWKADVSPQGVYDRMVTAQKGFGSFCFGQNTLFQGILRGLRYRVYTCGSRPNKAPPDDRGVPSLGSLQHIALIVQLPSPSDPSNDDIYLVDVGFGGVYGVSGLVRPIRLSAGETVAGSMPPEQHRVIIAQPPPSALSFPENAFHSDWMLQANRDPEKEQWRTLYHFSLTCELFESDVECQSFAVSNQLDSPLVNKLIVVKVFAVEGDPEKLGRLSLIGDKLARRIGASSEIISSFETENERVAALKQYCGILLEGKDVSHIRGRKPALPVS